MKPSLRLVNPMRATPSGVYGAGGVDESWHKGNLSQPLPLDANKVLAATWASFVSFSIELHKVAILALQKVWRLHWCFHTAELSLDSQSSLEELGHGFRNSC